MLESICRDKNVTPVPTVEPKFIDKNEDLKIFPISDMDSLQLLEEKLKNQEFCSTVVNICNSAINKSM